MKRFGLLTLATLAVTSVAFADGTGSSKGLKRSAKAKTTVTAANTAETGLVSVKLYDTGVDLVRKFGSPDDIQDVASGTGGGAVGPAGGGGRGGPGRPAGGGGGGQTGPAQTDWNIPELDWKPINLVGQTMRGAAGAGGAPTPAPAGGGGQPGGTTAPGAAPTGNEDRIVYTRWIYKRGNSRYAFVLNRYSQVIQIEAIGSNDPRVSTSRGVRYGTQFADIVKKYGAPDGYEISGNTLVVRYLVKNKVAFRMNRLVTDGKHVVTGIVVAAGKT